MKTPGQRIAETVYHLEDGETYASVEGKRAALARRIDTAIAKHKVRTPREGVPETSRYPFHVVVTAKSGDTGRIYAKSEREAKSIRARAKREGLWEIDEVARRRVVLVAADQIASIVIEGVPKKAKKKGAKKK